MTETPLPNGLVVGAKEASAHDLDSHGGRAEERRSETLADTKDGPSSEMSAKVPNQKQHVGIEVGIALAATALFAFLLLLLTFNAGPLWRDETNTINIARMPLRELWANLSFESFPPLYLLLLRAWSFLGMTDSDAGIRLLGFFVGLGFLGSLWTCVRWMKVQAPTLALALLGSLPAFLFTVEVNRAYGLAMCLLLLTFGLIWRLVEEPSLARIMPAALVSVLFLHCVYYDALFFGAMLAGAGLVVLRRRQWKTLGVLVAIGAAGGATMAPYLPVIHRGSVYLRIVQTPSFNWAQLCSRLSDSLSPRSGGEFGYPSHLGAFVWIAASVAGIAVALVLQFRSKAAGEAFHASKTPSQAVSARGDLAMYSAVTLVCGVTAYLLFLRELQFPTQRWYYMGMASLCAISLEGLLNASWSALLPWGMLRLMFLVAMAMWGGGSVWREAHTRRSNVDMIAAVLEEKCQTGDLIVVQNPWVAITFDRYYHGAVQWVTIPPIDSHKVHRTDLISKAMAQPDCTAPVIKRIGETLENGGNVWLVGRAGILRTAQPFRAPPPPPRPGTGWWLEPYWQFWCQQVNENLMSFGARMSVLVVPVQSPVNIYEDISLLRFHGYQAKANGDSLK